MTARCWPGGRANDDVILSSPGSWVRGRAPSAHALAAALRLPFVDCDERIVAIAGKPIPQIFAEDGEAAFRTLEAHVLTSLLKEESSVLALGGGTLASAENLAAGETRGNDYLPDRGPNHDLPAGDGPGGPTTFTEGG